MEVYALIGPSGTGKSYRAVSVAKELDIHYIIDDGLLIKGNRVLAGKSAKREATRVGATKRAIFTDKGHSEEVARAIKIENAQSIMIIGTSDKMVDQIAKAIEVGVVKHRIYIEDVSSDSEITTARKVRKEQGKHVIPVPTFEIKKDFSGYFIDPLKILRERGASIEETERSVVRPTFSYLGKYEISDVVVESIVIVAAMKTKGVAKVNNCDIISTNTGMQINVFVTLLALGDLLEVCRKAQASIKKDLEYMTGLNILGINVTIKSLVPTKEEV